MTEHETDMYCGPALLPTSPVTRTHIFGLLKGNRNDMVDDMYPDNLPPEVGFPLMAIGLGFYFYSVIKERRAEVKARMELRKASK